MQPEPTTTGAFHSRWRLPLFGAPIVPALVPSLQEAFPDGRVFNGYGMTETAAIMTVLPHHDAVEHADSVGYALRCGKLAEPRVKLTRSEPTWQRVRAGPEADRLGVFVVRRRARR